MSKFIAVFLLSATTLLVVLLIPASPALAFKRNIRCQIIRDAIMFAPTNLQDYLVNNFEAVHKGIHHVDTHDKRLGSLNPYAAKEIYHSMIDSINKDKLCTYNTAHRFGVMAGYLAETVNPVEHKKLRDLIPGQVLFDGYHEVNDIHHSLSRIIRDYRNPYYGQQRREVTDFLYVVAVNEIVDHWISAWLTGDQEIGEEKLAGYDIQRVRQADLLRGVNLKLPG